MPYDGIKLFDYFSSVGIEEYHGNRFSLDLFVNTEYKNIDAEIKKLMLPTVSINIVQERLLKVAPFNIEESLISKFNTAGIRI